MKIVRFNKNGWGPAGKNQDNVETLMFNIYIDSIDGMYQLSCVSTNKNISDDSVHNTIKELKDYAKEIFGINYDAWQNK